MSVDVAQQSAYVSLIPPKLAVASQTAYVAIIPGTGVNVSSQTAYLAMFDTAPPVGRRRVFVLVTG